MASQAGSPRMGPPNNPPVNTQNRSPMAGPGNSTVNSQNPYYSAHPQQFAPGNYYLAPPPMSPAPYEYDNALQHW